MQRKQIVSALLIGLASLSPVICSADAAHALYNQGMTHFYDMKWNDAMQSFQQSAQIYMQSGQYHNASSSNVMAVAALTKYVDDCREQGVKPSITYQNRQNYDFLRTTATFEGRKQISVSAAHDLAESVSSADLKREPTLQWFIPAPYFVNTRFGLWDKMLKEPKPNSSYQYALGMWHYGRGMAYAHQGNLSRASSELAELHGIVQKGPGPIEVNFGAMGVSLLSIADEVLTASIAEKKGNEEQTISHLKAALALQDSLGSEQSGNWYFPVKEALGDAYLKWGHPQLAMEMYQQDLKQYPKNGWALNGMVRTLRAMGDKKKAALVEKEFKVAWQDADIGSPVILF